MESNTESCLSIFVNKKSLASLESWKESQGVSLVQVNGQRIYGSPPAGWRGPAPSHSCEVFISNIPRDVFEDKLVPLFEKVGQLYEFRLMMNFSGQNRGFAFAKYREPRGARAAVLWLHRYELPGGCRLAVVKSVEKRRLLIGGLPRALAGSQLQGALRHLAEGVASVTVPPGPAESETAFAVAEYVSHRAASMAKKVVCEGFQAMFGLSVAVSWLTPRAQDELQKLTGAALPCPSQCPEPWAAQAELPPSDRRPRTSKPRAGHGSSPAPPSGSARQRLSCFIKLSGGFQHV